METFRPSATIFRRLGCFRRHGDPSWRLGAENPWGNHDFHVGLQFKNYRDNFLYPGNEGLAGFFNFNGQYTGNGGSSLGSGLADFMLGLPDNLGIGEGVGNRHVRNNLWSVYGQDNWRVRSNLTLNLGLRWELNTPRAAGTVTR